MKMDVHFRADIHAFRDQPHEQPFETTVLFGAMRDASVGITASGTYAQTQGPCTDTFTFNTTINLLSPYDPSQEGGWTYFGSVDSQSHTLQLNLHLQTLSAVGSWVRSGLSHTAHRAGVHPLGRHDARPSAGPGRRALTRPRGHG